MSTILKERIPLKDILQLPIDDQIIVKIYDTKYSVNIKIYEKNETLGTQLFVNVDLDQMQIPGLKNNYLTAVHDYIKKNIRLTIEYDQGNLQYFVVLRNYRT